MKKAILIILAILLVVVVFLYFWNKVPKAKLVINKDGSGYISFGGKTRSFPAKMGTEITLWNQYRFSGSASDYFLGRFTKTIARSENITPYMSGNGYVEIVRN